MSTSNSSAASSSSPGKTPSRCYLDIDINGHREAHARCVAFVEATNLRYGFSSPTLSLLGGAEKARIGELYENDYDWKDRGRIETEPPKCERMIFELYVEQAPNAVDNFRSLCMGSRGKAKGSGLPLSFKKSKIFRSVPGLMCQGGDFVHNNGAGGESIWGDKFKDEKGGLFLKHDARGVLSMSNSGKNSNGSQFFITFKAAKHLDGKHVIFGRLVEGMEVLDAIEAVPVKDEKPTLDISVVDCGSL